MEEAFVQAIKLLIKKELKANISIGRVKSIDGAVCDVERDDLPELLEVRLNSINKSFNSSFTVIPKVGSEVLCAVIEGNDAETYIIATSEIEAVEIWFDADKKKGVKITADGAVFDEGNNGGMTITPELKTQLDIMSSRIDTIINAINNGTPASGSSDGGTSYQLSMSTILNTISAAEDFSNIENERIKH